MLSEAAFLPNGLSKMYEPGCPARKSEGRQSQGGEGSGPCGLYRRRGCYMLRPTYLLYYYEDVSICQENFFTTYSVCVCVCVRGVLANFYHQFSLGNGLLAKKSSNIKRKTEELYNSSFVGQTVEAINYTDNDCTVESFLIKNYLFFIENRCNKIHYNFVQLYLLCFGCIECCSYTIYIL